MTPSIHISLLPSFSTDGQVYRAFGHLVVSRMGTLLLVPLHLVSGRCDEVVDGCPVNWEEVFAVLEYPATHPLTRPDEWRGTSNPLREMSRLGIDPSLCVLDHIAPMANGRETVLRLVHPCGVRYAEVMP